MFTNFLKNLFGIKPKPEKCEVNVDLEKFTEWKNKTSAEKQKEIIANRNKKYMIAPGYVSPHYKHKDYKRESRKDVSSLDYLVSNPSATASIISHSQSNAGRSCSSHDYTPSSSSDSSSCNSSSND